ncbi:MAG: glycosyltransferase family 2 protein [Acidimicrobiia bacterium]
MPAITVVVPIHNEAAFLPVAFPRLLAELEHVPADCRVILVENGSSDDTAAVAERLSEGSPVEVRRLPEPDYGGAMRDGFLAADGDWVVNFDIDYFSGGFLGQVLELADRADLVIASKRDPQSEDRRSPLRRTGTAVFNLLLRLLFGSRVSDTHGMKAFRREVVTDIAPSVRSTEDLFDTELVLRAERAGYRIVEVPVVVEEMREARSSFLKRVPRTLRGLAQIRRWLASERPD